MIVCGDDEYEVPYYKVAMCCEKFADPREFLKQCPGNRYLTHCQCPRVAFEAFLEYIDRTTKETDAASVITKENYGALRVLSDEFECVRLRDDVDKFERERMRSIGDHIQCLSSSGSDSAYVHEDALSSDVDGCLEYLRSHEFGSIPAPSLCNIISKSVSKGNRLNSTLLCRFLLEHRAADSSYAPLVSFIDLSELPGDLGIQLLEDPRVQSWMKPSVEFPVLARIAAVCEELRSSYESELRELKSRNEFLEAEITRLRDSQAKFEVDVRGRVDSVLRPVHNDDVRRSIISWLRQKETHLMSKLLFTRMSSNDIYAWLDPGAQDQYGSMNSPGAWIEIEFKSPVRANGLTVTSNYRKGSHPKTFDVILSDGAGKPEKQRIKFENDDMPNKDGASVTREFETTSVKMIRIESCGPNWDGLNFFRLGGFELLSPDDAYSGGVFRSLFSQHRDDIYDFFDVRARDFDGSEIHVPTTEKNVWTWGFDDNEWFEVEFLRGRVGVRGYRIRKSKDTIREWSVRGSNDRSLPTSEWEVIHRHREEEKTDETLEFECALTTPFRFLRVVNEGPQWDGKCRELNFKYFDVDGIFIPD